MVTTALSAPLPEPDPVKADRRRARKRARLPADAACCICGETDGEVLEVQHVLGEEAAPDVTVVLCRNDHARQTGAQYDQKALPPPGPAQQRDTIVEVVERILRGLAVFAHALALALVAYADALRAMVVGLDLDQPEWRETGWAQWPVPLA